ncbi:tyrosine-type recombinase/integrase [Clostridium guangxiense]|uniref:tyrosine-type recombinase/integrase n=1 Tax=Clostridium guangxiense TaxID=1662055 RepID=UPI001E52DE5D|nr:tyrosine-type recombinase/integrase [Clostridium guangxiense]MCD2346132.1 tyrosine-type recombinase/integrase [Clostridium guangxiense]
MSKVEPIRDKKQIDALKKYLLGWNLQYYCLINFMINVPLRVSDVLSLKWKDVYDYKKRTFNDHIVVKEKKTGKLNTLVLNDMAVKGLKMYLNSLNLNEEDEYIFKSREGISKPLTRQRVSQIIKSSCAAVGIKENVNCHTMRKSMGYHLWNNGISPAVIMEIYNHSNLTVSKRYFGVNQLDKDNALKNIKL